MFEVLSVFNLWTYHLSSMLKVYLSYIPYLQGSYLFEIQEWVTPPPHATPPIIIYFFSEYVKC